MRFSAFSYIPLRNLRMAAEAFLSVSIISELFMVHRVESAEKSMNAANTGPIFAISRDENEDLVVYTSVRSVTWCQLLPTRSANLRVRGSSKQFHRILPVIARHSTSCHIRIRSTSSSTSGSMRASQCCWKAQLQMSRKFSLHSTDPSDPHLEETNDAFNARWFGICQIS